MSLSAQRVALALGAAALALSVGPVSGQTLEGVTLGAPVPQSLPAPERQQDVGQFVFAYYPLSEALALSIWSSGPEDGAVLSVQLARTAPHYRAEAPLDGVEFGVTTTRLLEARYGPPGPVYEIVGATSTFGDITTHTLSYETDDGASVVTFVTLEDINQPDTTGRQSARLDAIILADRVFQESLWGTPRYPDPGYEPIANPLP